MVKKTRSIAILCILFLCCGCMGEKKDVKHIFGATYMTRNNPYFDALNDEITEGIETNGDKLIVRDPLQDQEKQNEQILDMIQEGIEVLFLNPVDREKVKPALKACKKANVKIINIDTQVKDKDYVLTTIETDNYQAGQECAKDMIKRVKKAKILILDNPNQKSITERVDGFLSVINDNSDYKVVKRVQAGSEIEVSTKVVQQIIKEEIKFNVVFGGNDPTALGALAAANAAGMKDVMIYGVDGSPDVKAELATEGSLMEGTGAQSPIAIAEKSVEIMYSIMEGKEVDARYPVETFLITADNVKDYGTDGWQ